MPWLFPWVFKPQRLKSVLDLSGQDMMTAEAISKILLPVVDRIDQLNGNLFSRKVPTDSIKNMNYQELKYWNKWHELIEKAEIKAYEKNRII